MDLHISINFPVYLKLLKPAIFQAMCQGEAAYFDPESGGKCDLPALLALPKSYKVIRLGALTFQWPEGAELGAVRASTRAYRAQIYPAVRNRSPQPFWGRRQAPEPWEEACFLLELQHDKNDMILGLAMLSAHVSILPKGLLFLLK